MTRILLLFVMATLVAGGQAAGQAIFVVRHAERADAAANLRGGDARAPAGQPSGTMMADDPELSAVGRERAQSLAAMLRDADIRAIYSSDLKRAQQTAAPLAAALQLVVQTVPAKEVGKLLEKVRPTTGNVLIVGHSNTIPEILSGLGIPQRITIADSEYDNLFIVVRDDGPSLVRLRFR